MIFKLACLGSIHRPMPAIVNPWGHFVGHQRLTHLEPFDGQHPYIIQRLHDLFHGLSGLLFQGMIGPNSRRGGDGFMQNPMAVKVFHQGVMANFPLCRSHRNLRKLAIKRNQPFQNQRLASQCFPAFGHFQSRVEAHLPFAIVTEAARFKDCRKADGPGRLLQIF